MPELTDLAGIHYDTMGDMQDRAKRKTQSQLREHSSHRRSPERHSKLRL